MQILLEPITLTEEKDLFYSTRNEPKELGCIGHLRGDFGSDGKEFFSTWFPHECEELNDQRFKTVFDTLINQLRKAGQVLSGRTEMERYCLPHHDCKLLNPYVDKCWGFRIYSPNHYAFYLRCMPVRGDYNFYIYCYDKNMLLDKLARDRGLPRYCYTHNSSIGEDVLLTFPERGFRTCRGVTSEKSAATLNKDLGVTYRQVAAMQAGSMFSWNAPAADPKNYDESGRPILRNSDREER